MKTLVLAASLLSFSIASPVQTPSGHEGTWTARLSDSWTRNDNERWISFQLERRGRDGHYGIGIPASELADLGMRGERWTASGVQFSLRRDAGTVNFEGSFDEGRGRGTYRFVPNADFASAMQRSYGSLDGDD